MWHSTFWDEFRMWALLASLVMLILPALVAGLAVLLLVHWLSRWEQRSPSSAG
ncbi:MAG: hypothetical protein GXO54_02405 [Chloroflexi bacterium]|nr:hypothetical protein [Chloroflexota bacterium]